MEHWVLWKKDPIKVYFERKDKTGWTLTSNIQNAMKFNTKEEAIEYNHSSLYGEFEPERIIYIKQ